MLATVAQQLRGTNAPTDALNDVSTRPDKGSTNPFAGAKRDTGAESPYTVNVLNERPPETRAPNTLYAGVPGQTGSGSSSASISPTRSRSAS